MKKDQRYIEIELCADCQAKCTFCPRQHLKRNTTILSIEKLNIILQQIKTIDEKITIFFTGNGEPLLNKDGLFFALQNLADAPNRDKLRLILTTNGRLIDEAFIKNPLIAQIDRLDISAAGYNTKDYARQYLCSWQETLQKILALRKAWPQLTINVKAVNYRRIHLLPLRRNEIFLSCREHNILYSQPKIFNIGGLLYKTGIVNTPEMIATCACQIFVSSDGLYVWCPVDFEQKNILASIEQVPLIEIMNRIRPGCHYPEMCKHCDIPQQNKHRNRSDIKQKI